MADDGKQHRRTMPALKKIKKLKFINNNPPAVFVTAVVVAYRRPCRSPSPLPTSCTPPSPSHCWQAAAADAATTAAKLPPRFPPRDCRP